MNSSRKASAEGEERCGKDENVATKCTYRSRILTAPIFSIAESRIDRHCRVPQKASPASPHLRSVGKFETLRPEIHEHTMFRRLVLGPFHFSTLHLRLHMSKHRRSKMILHLYVFRHFPALSHSQKDSHIACSTVVLYRQGTGKGRIEYTILHFWKLAFLSLGSETLIIPRCVLILLKVALFFEFLFHWPTWKLSRDEMIIQ